MAASSRTDAADREPATGLRRLRRHLILIGIVYFFAGTASQKLVPGVDEVFPFFGWSLFSRVPNEHTTYKVMIRRHEGHRLERPVNFLRAPESMVRGDRYIARKVIQHLGKAQESGDAAQVERQRRLLEETYLIGEVRYDLVVERYRPLARWRTGAVEEPVRLARFTSGVTP